MNLQTTALLLYAHSRPPAARLMRASLVAEVAPVLAPGVYDTRKHTRSKHACATANYAVQLSPVFGMLSILPRGPGRP